MGLLKLSCVLFWVLSILSFRALCDSSEVTVKFLKAPRAFSHLNSSTFVFKVFRGGRNGPCTNCSVTCKLDDGIASDCEATRRVSYAGLQDGNHTFEVCTNGSRGIGCASYKWNIDTVPPTAYITASTPFTNALNVSVNISFSEPCTGGGGFGCSSVNACNVLVYGAGQVIPSSLKILEPNLKYSVLVDLSSTTQYGRVIVVMDKNFCTDSAGNKFTRTANSSFYVHVDRRSVFVNLRSHIPERLIQFNGETRLVQATNSYDKLKVYLYFSKPVLNSSAEILNSLQTSQCMLLPIRGENIGDRRFGFLVANISDMAIVTLSIDSNSIISLQGTPVSAIAPVTFLYDSLRPVVRLSTTSYMRTTEHNIPILIKFMKPVFGFNSSNISITGGYFKSFREISRSLYAVELQADHDIVSVNVPENVTEDVAGNKNLASNVLQVRHYSVPKISSVISAITTASFLVTSFAAGLLTVSIASLHSTGTFSRLSFCDPSKNLFRIACHIQVFALSRWLVVTLPVEYYGFAMGLRWSIPYFSLPWETERTPLVMPGSSSPAYSNSYMSKIHDSGSFQNVRSKEENLSRAASLYGLPLTPVEYRSYFESPNMEPEAEYILDPHILNGWRDFSRSMFWLAIIGGSLILLHALLLVILKFRKKNSEKQKGYGALTFPRFEIFLIILSLPCVCEASAGLIRGGVASGIVVGILLLGVVSSLLLVLFLFLSIGITFGKLLQYKEVHQEGQRFQWYQDIIRVTLGPNKRGQWTWKNQPNADYLTMLGPLFEDLRGPPKYMLSQISGGNSIMHGDRIIASDDETEDAEAPVIQKLFGILRIYYTLLEFMRRVSLGIMAGAYRENYWSTNKTPTITLLCITSFQLFFLVLKKPFIKKKVQLVEIIAVSTEVGLFAICLVLLEKEFSDRNETIVGVFMLILFMVGYIPQMANQWYALYKQTKQLDPVEKSFLKGLRVAAIGFLLLFIPQKLTEKLESRFMVNHHGDGGNPGVAVSSVESNKNAESRSLGTANKPWSKQLRELAKASFSKEGSGATNDPSTSRTKKWSGFWSSNSNSES